MAAGTSKGSCIMKILDKYIGRHVVVGSLMALVILVSIDMVFAFGGEVADIGQGDYDFLKSLYYILLTAPRRAYDFIPMAAIVGSMVMLGGLASNSEFVAMRSAGVSITQIALSMVKGGLVLVLLALIVGETVAPFTEPYAQQMRTFARSQSTALKSENGIWARDGLSFVNILQLRPGGELRRLDIYEFDEDFQLRIKTHADRAVFEDNAWVLFNIEQVEVLPDKVEITNYKKAKWGALLNPDLLSVLAVKPEHLPIWRLTTYIDYLASNGLDTEPYKFAYWQKITAPFAIIVMLLLSVPFIFSSLRTTGAGQMTLIGIVLGIGYYLLVHVTGRMGEVYNFNPILTSITPIILFSAAGFISFRFTR
jgi:lipopolysaccharide export system permease protein